MNQDKQMIVSFGKYKDKPIEQFLQDENYIKWLLTQEFFKEKYQNEYKIVINNYNAQPVDTPEHNEMQVKYIGTDYRVKVAYAVLGDELFKHNQSHIDENLPKLLEQFNGIAENYLIEFKERLRNELHGREFLQLSEVSFEEKGVDVEYDISYGYADISYTVGTYNTTLKEVVTRMWAYSTKKKLRIELKPTVGDDFPAVLRQIKNNKSNVVIIKEYTGVGASYEEFKQFFESQERVVLKQSDIGKIVVPEFDKIISLEKYINRNEYK